MHIPGSTSLAPGTRYLTGAAVDVDVGVDACAGAGVVSDAGADGGVGSGICETGAGDGAGDCAFAWSRCLWS